MKVGFTGTQDGMTDEQARAFHRVLRVYAGVFHHGDCVGGRDPVVFH